MEHNVYTDKAIELVEKGESLFITGKAGTGKTYLLQNLIVPKLEELGKEYAITAPTGVAANHAGGVTIHSFLRLPLSPYIPKMTIPDLYSLKPEEEKIVRRISVLIIDEISMVRCDVMDAIDDVLRHYRKNDKPFGGLQLLLFGDLYQLMPVAETEMWEKLSKDGEYKTPYFFSSKVLESNMLNMLELKKVYRQRNDMFVSMLNAIRIGNHTQLMMEKLNKRVNENFKVEEHSGYIKLTALNKTAKGHNWGMLQSLQGHEYELKGFTEGFYPPHERPTDLYLHLKVGAQVMIVRNDNDTHSYYNGTMGKITDISPFGITVKKDNGEKVLVEKQKWDFYRYHINKQTKRIERELCGSFTQYPLKLAWAITVHKSQGLTFEKVMIDVSRAFATGQVYVALSRCSSFYKMVLASKIPERLIKIDPAVKTFMERTKRVDVDDFEFRKNEKKGNFVELGREDTYWMAREGLTVEEMVHESGKRIEFIYADLTRLIEQGKLVACDFIDPETYKEIEDVFRKGKGKLSLKEIKERCSSYVKYGEICMFIASTKTPCAVNLTVKRIERATPSVGENRKQIVPKVSESPITSKAQNIAVPTSKTTSSDVLKFFVKSEVIRGLLLMSLPVYKRAIIDRAIAEQITENPDYYNRTYLSVCPLRTKKISKIVFETKEGERAEADVSNISYCKGHGRNGVYWIADFRLKNVRSSSLTY